MLIITVLITYNCHFFKEIEKGYRRITDKQPIPHKHMTPIFCNKGICRLHNDTMGTSINITSLVTFAIAVPRCIPDRRRQAVVGPDRLHPSWIGLQAVMIANTRAVLVIHMQLPSTQRMYFHTRTVWSRR